MGGTVKFGDWISEGWNLFLQEWRTWSLMGLLLLLPLGLLMVAFVVPIVVVADLERGFKYEWIVPMIIGSLVFIMVLGLYMSLTMAGMYRAAFRQLEGHRIFVSDLWSGTQASLRVFAANIMILFMTIVGAVLCYVPALIVGGLTYFTIPLIVRRGCSPVEGLSQSVQATKKDWIMFTIFALAVGLIAQVGTYACYIGIIFSLPLAFTIGAVAYRDCFEREMSKPSPREALYGKNCKACGASIPVRAVFCDRCGAGQV